MSMMARFVAVAPKRLDAVRNSPEQIEALFMAEMPPARVKFRQALQECVRNQTPEALPAGFDGYRRSCIPSS